MSAYTRHRAFQHVLDIGCGDGSLSLPFLSPECSVTFIDLSNAMLEIVTQKVPDALRPQAKFFQGEFADIDLPPASFDLAIFVGVLAYVSDVRIAAERIHRLVRPGGFIIVECTDAGHALARLNFGYRDLTGLLRPGKCHTYRHRAADVVGTFESAGFHSRRSFRYTYSLPTSSWFLSQNRTYSLISRLYGTAEASRHQRLGSELLTLFEVA